jgi:hypothetical protein
MEKKEEFTEFSIPEWIADPEEREFLKLVNRIAALANKKEYTLALLAHTNKEEGEIIIVMGCLHCVEFLLDKVMENTPQLRDALLSSIIRNMEKLKNKQDTAGKDTVEKQLISYAKKNTPAGN